tara:strand:+ start:428 stop:562 length:135 start_codon:yes stop_codon:yes gene_type:complete
MHSTNEHWSRAMTFEDYADRCAPAFALLSTAYLGIRIGIALILT